jgi:amino acid adenylation domain-containing protein
MQSNHNLLITSSEYKRFTEFWKTKLSSVVTDQNPTTDHKVRQPSPYSVEFSLAEVDPIIDEVSNGHHLGAFVILLSGIQYLLSWYTGRKTMVIDTPFLKSHSARTGNRKQASLIEAIDDQLTVRDFLGAVKQTVAESYSYCDYPVEALHSTMTQQPGVKFQADISICYPLIHEAFDGLSKYPLNITITRGRETILRVESDGTVLENHLVALLGSHLVTFISSIHNTSVRLNELNFVPVAIYERLTQTSDQPIELNENETVISAFDEIAATGGQLTSVIYGERSLSFSQVRELSVRLAAHLVNIVAVKKGDVICVISERNEFTLPVILGIMRAGAVYLPVSPGTPVARIQYMIKQASAAAVIFSNDTAHLREQCDFPPAIIVDDNFFSGAKTEDFVTPSLCSSDLAYIIFTSGSTGAPKGVLVEHGGLLHRSLYYQEKFNISSKDRVLQFLSLSFDGSVLDIFSAVVSGAALVMPEERDIFNTDLFIDCVTRNNVTLFVVTPSYLSLLRQHPLPTVRLIVSAGEAVKPHDANFYRRTKEFYNAYGPSEVSIVSTVHRVDNAGVQIPIGKSVPGVHVYIMDENMRLASAGMVGELCIAGIGVARGYLGEPELTSQKFVPNPFQPGEVLYKTGDLGKWTSDGNILFIGRRDDQIKINGLRIDLDEIRSAFLTDECIDDIAVTFENGKDIVCFYTARNNTHDIAEHLKGTGQRVLPHYMMPSRFIGISELPRTANDKVDKESLHNLYLADVADKNSIFLPETPAEEYLHDTWQALLGTAATSKSDSFFELGGNSLLATQLISKIDRDLDVQIRIRDIFEHPEIGELATLIGASRKSTHESIANVEEQEYYDLSHAQKRLWIIDQLNVAAGGYSIVEAFTMAGRVDVQLIERAFEIIVRRHESLRTIFPVIDGEPKQKILDFNPGHHSVHVIDLVGHADADNVILQEIDVQSLMSFDLEKGPLIRIKLFKLSADKCVIVLSLHHIISDGWSMKVLANEFFSLYNNIGQQAGYTLAPLRIQYKDFAEWQNARSINTEVESYWLSKFSGELPITKMPADFRKTSTYRGDMDSISTIVQGDAYARLLNIGKDNNASLFMVMLSAINIFLYKYTSQTDVVLGTVVSGRNNVDLEGQIGYYLSTLPLRTKFSSNENFLQLLKAVRQVVLEAYEFQAYPFDKLVDKLDLRRDSVGSPLFDILVDFHSTEMEVSAPQQRDLNVTPLRVPQGKSKYDITIGLLQSHDELNVVFEYDRSLFRRDTVERFVACFNNILVAVCSDPQAPLSEVSMLSLSDRRQLLESFNAPVSSPSKDTIVGLFEAQVSRTGHDLALSFEGDYMTYEELNRKANQLARYLVEEFDLRKNDIVGLMCDRSLQCIVSLLAIMKAGAAFLPVDATYPVDKKRHLLIDARAKVLLADSTYLSDLDYYDGALFALDVQLQGLTTSTENLPVQVVSSDRAYVIYTSGSTGLPKGVEVIHESFVNYVTWSNRYYFGDTTGHTFGLFTSLSFDLTLTSIFTTLLRGDKLVIYNSHKEINDILTEAFDSSTDVDTVKLTPSHISLLGHLPIGSTNVRDVIVGGEAFTAEQLRILRRLNSFIKVYNEYGPTEATVGCTVKEVLREEDMTIGTPIENARIYIMDKDRNMVPPGVEGEIAIGGTCVARGYLNNPDLTAAKFIADPFTSDQQSRIYLTGDFGKWLPSGEIEYLGRRDAQIKIRGHRIELGEIESYIAQHPDVQQVIAFPKHEEDHIVLVAAVVLRKNVVNERIVDELKTQCAMKLPRVAVPGIFVVVDSFPLTQNGKIDKQALDQLSSNAQPMNSFTEPSNLVEEKILRVWKEVLRKDMISTTSNFFELGGDSLKSVQITAMLYKELGIRLKLSFLFDYPTIQTLAEAIQEKEIANSDVMNAQITEVII